MVTPSRDLFRVPVMILRELVCYVYQRCHLRLKECCFRKTSYLVDFLFLAESAPEREGLNAQKYINKSSGVNGRLAWSRED